MRTSPQPDKLSSTHPRRPPAHKSVSLLHSRGSRPISESASSSDSEKAQPSQVRRSPTATDSPSSLEALGGRNSSGETSNAEKWFEKSNNEVRDSSTTFVDNDPPFFMRNCSSESPPDPQNSDLRHFSGVDDGANSLPLHTELLQLGTEGSSVDDFRSVIDDLTVENKKLKRRLKKYEKLHDSHLKDEKLFEVRIHGLPPDKKKELEETLRKFASSLGTTGANAFPADGYSSLLPLLKQAKTVSSQTSLQNADSAYASMSASGQGTVSQSGIDNKQKDTPTQYMAARRKNIHSYLHHIPEGLLPQQNPSTMTERARKKLVVRRMEQLFAGKGALPGGPEQSMQQQEVSQTAARAERSALEAQGQLAGKEGSREAHIMKQDAEEQMSSTENRSEEKVTGKQSEKRKLPQPNPYKRSPDSAVEEQRPTRPLDLDPHRAQVPAENIRYMRQMGFSPPDPYAGRSPEEDHGWIYLNFLINMAQLHTINVTSEFVRKALGEYSNKFEVSSDGRRVRWKGAASLTRNSSSGGGSSNERMSNETNDGQTPRKRAKLTHSNVARSNFQNGGLSSHPAQCSRAESSRHVYTPLFSHRDESDTDESSSEEEEDSEESPQHPALIAGNSSGMTSSRMRTSSGVPGASVRKKQMREDGPIIFYNNARFCTDLSGDRKPTGSNGGPVYTPASSLPVGKPVTTADQTLEKRGPLAEASSLPEPMDLSDNPIPESLEVSFPPDSPSKPPSSNGQDPIELEVTGIGGVWPADNFSISVDSRHASTPDLQNPNAIIPLETKALPPRVRQILESSGITPKSHPVINKQFVASAVRGLPPSELPPALAFMPVDDESLDEDSDADDDDASEAPPSPGALPPSAAPQRVDFQYPLSEADDDEEEDDSDDEESDDEVDFLATARQIDPEAVRLQEREYDANMAERLAEEIPAGSSAATAGGGSGFASPTDGFDSQVLRQARREARAQAAKMVRMKTSDSLVVRARNNSSSGDSDEDEDDEMSDAGS